MNHLFTPKVTIPTTWSGQQAKAVCDLLEDIVASIWEIHEHAILLAMNPTDDPSIETTPTSNDTNPDDYPF